jgi:hypothetical protein
MMKKKPTARLTLRQEATESSKQGKTKTNKKQKKTPTCEQSSCCKFGSKGKTQPYYWLATDHNTRTTQKTDQQKRKSRTLKERTARNKQRTTRSYATRSYVKSKVGIKPPKS